MIERNKKSYIFIILSIVWMAVIFMFSAQNAEQSNSQSDFLADVIRYILPFDLSADELEVLSLIIRKLAHFTEYAILGILYMLSVFYGNYIGKYKLILVTGLCCIYACTDELHQCFSEGRTPGLRDVVIDTAGGFCGALFILLIFHVCERKKKGKERNDSRKNGGIC